MDKHKLDAMSSIRRPMARRSVYGTGSGQSSGRGCGGLSSITVPAGQVFDSVRDRFWSASEPTCSRSRSRLSKRPKRASHPNSCPQWVKPQKNENAALLST